MTLSRIFLGSTIVAGTLLHGLACAGPTADMDYPQLMVLLTEAHANPTAVRPKLIGKTVAAKLVAGKSGLWIVSQEDGVQFACAGVGEGFKGGVVVAKVIQYEAPDSGEGSEPHLTLDRCAN